MAFLTTQQRSTFEKAIIKARNVAEDGAKNTLKHLAVDQPDPFPQQIRELRSLRNRLRSKGRLLGDKLLQNRVQEIQKLTNELAYEYWHKLLFARFLEANNLLMHPSGVSVTLDECGELASEEGYADKWDAAATYASKMLPAIFRPEDPLNQLKFSTNDQIHLETILNELEPELFIAEDSLGWVYQFWQTESKSKINASGDKIDGEKLPAVTQLFTESYMVRFLIDNTIGAWWIDRNPNVSPPVKFEYLRLLENGSPATGKFEGWPNRTSDITTLDPSMGSGHFLASLFKVFAGLRMKEEGLNKEEATDKVISQNLYGLEIDSRCTQLAAFNLALTAWKFCGKYKILPEMNLACSGMAPKGKVEDWIKLVGNVHRNDKGRMENGMRALYNHFQLAPELGSLLNPTTIESDAFTANFVQLRSVLNKALKNETDKDLLERGVMAAGIAKAGEILSNKYTMQITNVPYLTRQKQGQIIADYTEKVFPDSKNELATVFLEKMLDTTKTNGTVSVVIPQNWLFLPRYKKFRVKLLNSKKWNLVCRLGARSFSTPMFDFNVMLLTISNIKNLTDTQMLCGMDVSEYLSPDEKMANIKKVQLYYNKQSIQLKNQDSRIVFDNNESNLELLSQYAISKTGTRTADNPQFLINFFEIQYKNNVWVYEQTSPKKQKQFSGCKYYLKWENEKGSLIEFKRKGLASIQGRDVWGKNGVCLSLMGTLPASLYLGKIFDMNAGVIVPKNNDNLIAIWCYTSSKDYHNELRKIDQQLKLTTATLLKVPFDLEYWKKVAIEKYPNGLPRPYSNDATQWLFHGHPKKSDQALQVAVARLLDYRWPAENYEDLELSEKSKNLSNHVKDLMLPFDKDGIVCIPSVYNEHRGAERLRTFLQKTWKNEWNNVVLADLLSQTDSKKNNLEEWLIDEYFEQHCKVFHNRPFIWHIWDGRKDGFSALVNYHKLDKDNLKKLIYTYLVDWIRKCESKINAGESGADGLLSAALILKNKLELILEGEKPYDIFVRWKPIEEQPIGWEPDLNDGVRLNIRPFVEAGILRSRFNVKWGIDRGKNPSGSFWGEKRDNNIHLSLDEKRNSRKI